MYSSWISLLSIYINNLILSTSLESSIISSLIIRLNRLIYLLRSIYKSILITSKITKIIN